MRLHKSIPATRPPVRALLVDDSPLMLQTLARILADETGFVVVGSATNGRQAVLYAAMLAPELVLMDLHLPGLNGAQATQCIKQFENPPVVFMVTSDDSCTSRQMSAAAGADAFSFKSGSLHTQLRAKLHESFGPKAAHTRTASSPSPADGLAHGTESYRQ